MKKYIILITAISFGIALNASGPYKNKSKDRDVYHEKIEKSRDLVFQLDIINPSIGFETRLTNRNTFLMAFHSGDYDWEHGINFGEYDAPKIKTEFRSYYNFRKRVNEGKRINKFSGNFVSFYSSYKPSIFYEEQSLVIGPTWGIQRAYANFIHVNLNLGYGYVVDNNPSNDNTDFILDFRLGFVF